MDSCSSGGQAPPAQLGRWFSQICFEFPAPFSQIAPVAKPALGKGLDKLMGGDKVAGPSEPSSQPGTPLAPADPQGRLGRGVEKLLGQPEAQPKPPLLPGWFYFAADLLLLFLTVAICIAAPKPLSLKVVSFCVFSVTLGGALAIIGLRTGSSPR
jgi:hypothetical protein